MRAIRVVSRRRKFFVFYGQGAQTLQRLHETVVQLIALRDDPRLGPVEFKQTACV
jgi:hypothetical protein